MLEIQLFGPPHLISRDKRVLLSSKKVMGLLAYLAMRVGKPVSRSHLAGLLWSEVPEDQARNNLRQALSQLRKAFRDAGVDPIEASSQDITLSKGNIVVPAADISRDPDAVELVEVATGPGFLEGLSTRASEFDNWIVTERQSLEARMARALTQRSERLRQEGRNADAIEALSACLRLDPLNEKSHRALMELLAANARHEAALEQFDTCRLLLHEALGVEPSPETRELATSIRNARSKGAKAVEKHAKPTLSWLADEGPRTETHASISEALDAGLDRLAGDPGGRYHVGLGPADREALSEMPEQGVFVDAADASAFGQDSPFHLEDVAQAPHLRRVSPVARSRMMVSPTTDVPKLRIQDVLSVVVLPFREISQSAEDVSLGLLLAEEVSARLARFWQLTVASPSAAITCNKLGLTHDEIHERLGVNFAVEGNVFRLGNELKLSITITNLEAGELIASERFSGGLDELFEHQSDLVDMIATCVSRRTEVFAEKEAQRALTNDVGALDWFLRGLIKYRRAGINLSFAREAVAGFDNALSLDPDFVRSSALRACAIAWYDWDYVDSGKAMDDMRHALAVTDDDPEVHRIAGSLSMMSGDFDAGLAHAERAVQMNPSDAYLLGQSAIYWSWYGEPDKALPTMERAMMLDPFLPSWAVEDHGVILYSKGDFEDAIGSLQRLPVRQPRGLAFKAASQIAIGDRDGANRTVSELKRQSPDYSANQLELVTYYRDPEQTKALFGRLEQAGLT